MPVVEPSQVNCTRILGENLWPVAVTFVPGAPFVGDRDSVGPAALVPAKGTA
jgi:hypothetical protein